VGTTVGYLTFTDLDDISTNSFAFSTDTTDFTIDTATLVDTGINTGHTFSAELKTAATLDFETTPTYNVEVTVSDGVLSTLCYYTVNVQNANDELATDIIISETDLSPAPAPAPAPHTINGLELSPSGWSAFSPKGGTTPGQMTSANGILTTDANGQSGNAVFECAINPTLPYTIWIEVKMDGSGNGHNFGLCTDKSAYAGTQTVWNLGAGGWSSQFGACYLGIPLADGTTINNGYSPSTCSSVNNHDWHWFGAVFDGTTLKVYFGAEKGVGAPDGKGFLEVPYANILNKDATQAWLKLTMNGNFDMSIRNFQIDSAGGCN